MAAARELREGEYCLVGVGRPSTAALLAKRTHAPGLRLVYESGTIDTRPTRVPLSIGDPELAETAISVVSAPEIFNYWIQAGRIDVAFLGAAQIDPCGNLNTTVIGEYARPRVRLPGAGGAPEIAAGARRVIVIAPHEPRVLVERLDFLTSVCAGKEVTVVTDLAILRASPTASELRLTDLHDGVGLETVKAATGWPLRVSRGVRRVAPPTQAEIEVLRSLSRAGNDPA